MCCAAFAQADDWSRCIEGWQQRASQEGLTNRLVDQVIPALQEQARVLELDRRQPEFTDSFARYFTVRVSEQRVARGRELLVEHRALLSRLTREYGVPAQYLLAFWGLETNYGSFKGNMPTLDALATLACDKRRSAFFTDQLFHALHLVQEHGISPANMTGSWAGAVGHTQFMPGNYRRFAVDGDGDGKIDLWHSVPDALTSAANFLKHLGWEAGLRWGREVRLPKDFSFVQLIEQPTRSLREWREQGITTVGGKPLPDLDLAATIILPSGHEGPVFMTYHNFSVIMGWNRSEFYALSVGHLADRINGAGRLAVTPPAHPRLSLAQVRELQERLHSMGFSLGKPDGILGPATRQAIRGFQQQRGMIPDGFPAPAVFKALELSWVNDATLEGTE